MSIRVIFDRNHAKGRFVFAILVAMGIMFVPLLVFLSHSFILNCLSINNLVIGDFLDNLFLTYEYYHNSGFDSLALAGPERGYKVLIAYWGAFLLNGILVSFVVLWIQNRRERWNNGDLHNGEKTLGRFDIIVGGNEMGPNLVGQLLEDKKISLDYVLLMTNRNIEELRKSIVQSWQG